MGLETLQRIRKWLVRFSRDLSYNSLIWNQIVIKKCLMKCLLKKYRYIELSGCWQTLTTLLPNVNMRPQVLNEVPHLQMFWTLPLKPHTISTYGLFCMHAWLVWGTPDFPTNYYLWNMKCSSHTCSNICNDFHIFYLIFKKNKYEFYFNGM